MMSLLSLRLVALVCCLAILYGSLPACGQILLNPAVSVVTGYDNPLGLCSDSAGNFYVSDSGHFRVIKYSNAGVPLATFTTSNPALNFAYGCVVDSSNNIYIADAGNARVVKLSSVGAQQQVFTFTTQPMMYGAHGVALDAQSNLYVTDSYNNRVIIFNSTGGVVAMYSPTTPALNSPEGIAVSSTGVIYVSSQYSNQVVALSASNGSVLATISGPSATPLVNPFGLWLDSNQLLWVADQDNARVVQMNPATGTILQSFTNGGQLVQPVGVSVSPLGTVYVLDFDDDEQPYVVLLSNSTGQQLASYVPPVSLSAPQGVAINAQGSMFVADTGNNRVIQISPQGSTVAVWNLSTTTLPLNQPRSIALDSVGNMYVADAGNNRVVKLQAGTGQLLITYSTINPALSAPSAVTVDANGNVYIVDTGNSRVVKFNSSGISIAPVFVTINSTADVPFNNPQGICVDQYSNVYVADGDSYSVSNNRVVMFNAAGIQLAAYTAQLHTPGGCAVDLHGNIYISDTYNYLVKIINPTTGQYQVLTNTALQAPWGIQVAPSGAVYVASQDFDAIVVFNGTVNTSLPAAFPLTGSTASGRNVQVLTGYDNPLGLCSDSAGNFYVSDSGHFRVIKYSNAGVPLATFTTSNPALNFAYGCVVDSSNNIYIADAGNARVVKLSSVGAQQQVFTFTTQPMMYGAHGVALDAQSNLYVTDSYNNRVIIFNSTGGVVAMYSPTTPALNSPEGIAVSSTGVIYVSSQYSNQVVALSASNGSVLATISGPSATPLVNPFGLWLDSNQLLWVADQDNARVVQMNPATGTILQSFTNGGQLVQPVGVSVSPLGTVYVLDFDDDEQPYVVLLSNSTGQQLASYVPPVSLSAPQGVAINAQGSMFVADTGNNRVIQISPQGSTVAVWNLSTTTLPLNQPRSIALDSVGNMYVADAGNNRVVKLQAGTGQLLITYSTINPALSAPSAVTVDANGNVYIVDTGNSRVVKFNSSGISIAPVFVTINSTADVPFNNPQGICVDQYSNVYVADGDSYSVSNNRVVMFNAAGIQLAAYTAQLHTPGGCAVDLHGNIYISDTYNYLVKIINPTTGQYQMLTNTALQAPWGIQVAPSGAVYVASQDFDAIVIFSNASTALASSSAAPISLPSSTASLSSGSVASAVGSLCLLTYSLPGNIDYPWSTAAQVQVTYSPYPVINSVGTAVTIQSAVGTRTYTNRFGVSFTTPLSLATFGALSSSNLLYLSSASPVDSQGITWQLASPIQLPGNGPNFQVSFLNVHNASGIVVEGNSTRVDGLGEAFLSNIPGFLNVTIGASNINALAANYAACQAPLTFTNGLRAPTEPSASNGAAQFNYSYTVSDGATYLVQGNLTISTTSAFATQRDQLGSPYQTVINVIGTRLYTYLPTGATLRSSVNGISAAANPNADQRWYPYALLSSAPGVYSMTTAPFFDADGVEFNVSPSIPINGAPPGVAPLYTATSVYFSTPEPTAVLTENYYYNLPIIRLQQQIYTL